VRAAQRDTATYRNASGVNFTAPLEPHPQGSSVSEMVRSHGPGDQLEWGGRHLDTSDFSSLKFIAYLLLCWIDKMMTLQLTGGPSRVLHHAPLPPSMCKFNQSKKLKVVK